MHCKIRKVHIKMSILRSCTKIKKIIIFLLVGIMALTVLLHNILSGKNKQIKGEILLEKMEVLTMPSPEDPKEDKRYISKDGMVLLHVIYDDTEDKSILVIGAQELPFSYTGYCPRGEIPEIAFEDINADGIPDILMRGEMYKNIIRQDVYLSQPEGYIELGDVTQDNLSLDVEMTFLDDYKVRIAVPAYDIDETVDIDSKSFIEIARSLSVYDEKGKITEAGEAWSEDADRFLDQAIKYFVTADGDAYLRYEAQAWSGYSEVGLGWTLVREYKITEQGYELCNVYLERLS